jgi:hypothetical protein
MFNETVDGKILDRFWTNGLDGQPPSEPPKKMLKQKFEGYLK